MTGPFRSLAVRNFRLFTVGQVVSVAGTWMMIVAQDWLVLALTDDSAGALGMVTALQFAPLLLLTLFGGRLADRHDKRLLLTVANALSAVLALLLAALVLGGEVRLWHIGLFALALGVVNAVEVPARVSFVSEMVGAELLPNASALSAAYFSTARVVGPALAGVMIAALGTGWVMLLNAASYLATVVALRMMRPQELHRGAPETRARIVDGLRHVLVRPDLVLPLALLAVVGLCGLNFQLTLPLLAKTVFGADADAFGLLTTAFAAGSLAAALATTARRDRPSGRTVVVSALLFGALETVAGWSPGFVAAMVLLALTGFASIYFVQAANHRIQLGSDPRYRGRVMALYTLIVQGSTPLGALGTGWLAERFGARSGLVVGGLVSLAAAIAALLVERATAREAAAGAQADRTGAAGAAPPSPESPEAAEPPGPRERDRTV
ncbi:MFS transporter [Streptomyces sp. WMMC940]|uniref:MFS transporter n=1 Tax=Streptomyces sp. WMMC940 TaxID=3015153 RepID=UPI0022B61799|nr:MFS transporter [Streptomyces sp. WMMC940]MCZ7460205.1 MFS transporter [Streptomyces sp. WMMC940]